MSPGNPEKSLKILKKYNKFQENPEKSTKILRKSIRIQNIPKDSSKIFKNPEKILKKSWKNPEKSLNILNTTPPPIHKKKIYKIRAKNKRTTKATTDHHVEITPQRIISPTTPTNNNHNNNINNINNINDIDSCRCRWGKSHPPCTRPTLDVANRRRCHDIWPLPWHIAPVMEHLHPSPKGLLYISLFIRNAASNALVTRPENRSPSGKRIGCT